MAKKILYLHPASERGCMHVTIPMRDWQHPRSRKQRLEIYFSIDIPGAWWDDRWNVHVDGCDYPCASLQEALCRGIEVYDQPDPITHERHTYEVRRVGIPYDVCNDAVEFYHVDNFRPEAINYTLKAA